MAEQEFEGTLFLQKDKLSWRSIPKIGMSNIQKLKNMDDELWEDEIKGIEDQRFQQFQNTIGYDDIIDVKLLVIEKPSRN